MSAVTALTALASMATALRDAESAQHPSSKPHREALRVFAKRIAEVTHAVSRLDEEREKNWIPVASKLPDDQMLVIIALNDDDTWTGFLDAGIWRYTDGMPIKSERVTHWMPMPSPPARAAA